MSRIQPAFAKRIATQDQGGTTGETISEVEIADIHPGDLLLVNSGGPPPGKFEDISDEQWQKAIDGTLWSTVRLIRAALPERLRETAYALACDVAAADSTVTPEEARLLDLLRYELQIGKLVAAAIEAFWSSATWLPAGVKYGVAALCWAAVLAYFTFQGRRAR